MKHTIAVLVENKPGVLARIAGLFSARGFNIDSLAVGRTNDPTISRMTIVVDEKDERILEQIKKQLHKLIDVITVWDLTKKIFFERELILLKIDISNISKEKLDELIKNFGITVLFSNGEELIIEKSGENKQINELLNILGQSGVKELVRTGRIAIAH